MSASKISYKSEKSDTRKQRLSNKNFLFFVFINIELSFYNKYNRISKRYNIFSTKLVTASKSIISQVNWSEIILDVVNLHAVVSRFSKTEIFILLFPRSSAADLSRYTIFPKHRHCVGDSTKRYSRKIGTGFAEILFDEFADKKRLLTVAVIIVNKFNRALPACKRLVYSCIVDQFCPSLQVCLHIALFCIFVFVL